MTTKILSESLDAARTNSHFAASLGTVNKTALLLTLKMLQDWLLVLLIAFSNAEAEA